jgi:tetratricopeptide (TPR) repeat protein
LKQIHPRIKHQSEETCNTTTEISDPTIWNEKGNIQFQNKDYKEAIISYNHAIEISPSFGMPYHNLALIQFIQGNFDEAILLYQESIGFLNTDHEKAIAWNGLGNAYRCKKDYANALLAYQRASEMDKENGGVVDQQIVFEVCEEKRTANFWNELGMLFFKTGAYARAASAFRKSIDLEPSSGHSYSNLARVCMTQGQYKEALYLYRKSIDLIKNANERANAWNRLGDVHRKLNDYDNALKAYQKATTLKNDKMSLLNRARLSLLSNRKAN